ncbi:hypothetical protein HUS91_35845, partial [Pseudomonas chlororaphis]|uniref:hypothetical protein n=1 Tax=Pseudomonas chlororaphis TaxID=587753 RepID=UPI001B332B26
MTLSVSQMERIAELIDNSFAVKSIRDDAKKEKSNPLEVAGDYGTIANGLASFLDTPGRTVTSSI